MLSIASELPYPRISGVVPEFVSMSTFEFSLLSVSMFERPSQRLIEKSVGVPEVRKAPDSGLRTARAAWSEQERGRLRELYEERRSVPEIAELMSRTVRAVGTMVLRLGLNQRKASPSWTTDECTTILRLHAQGLSWAAIAAAMPDRSAVAIYRKLRHLVGPAPFSMEPTLPPPEEVAPRNPAPHHSGQTPSNDEPVKAQGATSRLTLVAQTETPRPVVVRPEPQQPVLATVDVMVRWLRSRDFMVIKMGSGWRVDQCVLADDSALVEFANIRRVRLRLPAFALSDAPPVVSEISHARANGWR